MICLTKDGNQVNEHHTVPESLGLGLFDCWLILLLKGLACGEERKSEIETTGHYGNDRALTVRYKVSGKIQHDMLLTTLPKISAHMLPHASFTGEEFTLGTI